MNIKYYDCPSFADANPIRGKFLFQIQSDPILALSDRVCVGNGIHTVYSKLYNQDDECYEIWVKGDANNISAKMENVVMDGDKIISFKRKKDGKVFKIGDWIQATDYSLIGKLTEIREDGLIAFDNISPGAGLIHRYIDRIDHELSPFTRAYNTDAGYGSSGGDKTKGSYPYFKKMIDEGHK